MAKTTEYINNPCSITYRTVRHGARRKPGTGGVALWVNTYSTCIWPPSGSPGPNNNKGYKNKEQGKSSLYLVFYKEI